ncbi:MAG TPA: carbohydrate kinase [Jatrophihabitans sp.]|nr:carbohydrate kinase [Jatrophihabitans sp.]
MTAHFDGVIAVIGEALIDLVETHDDEPRLARPGGSPYNVAIGLSRLGRHTYFVGRLSRDPLGAVLRNHAVRSDVDLSIAVDAYEPTTVALVELAADGSATYQFGVEGTADFRWTDSELHAVPDDVQAVHFGSLASWLPPGDAAIARRVEQLRGAGAFVSYDPNVRPHLQPDATRARDQVEAALALAHLVKTSEEDLAYVYPGDDVEKIASSWLGLGPTVVVVTRGGAGAHAYRDAGVVTAEPVPTTVVDTVGAGDSFMSGLLDAAAEHGLLRPAALAAASADAVGELLAHAGLVAAITCSRPGANPPRRSDLAAFR